MINCFIPQEQQNTCFTWISIFMNIKNAALFVFKRKCYNAFIYPTYNAAILKRISTDKNSFVYFNHQSVYYLFFFPFFIISSLFHLPIFLLFKPAVDETYKHQF